MSAIEDITKLAGIIAPKCSVEVKVAAVRKADDGSWPTCSLDENGVKWRATLLTSNMVGALHSAIGETPDEALQELRITIVSAVRGERDDVLKRQRAEIARITAEYDTAYARLDQALNAVGEG